MGCFPLLPGYNGIVQMFAMSITWECRSLPIRDTICYTIRSSDVTIIEIEIAILIQNRNESKS